MGLKVLIVDDEALARARLRSLLEDGQSTGGLLRPLVGEAAGAVQAMHLLQHQHWDVLLLDIAMPGMDGLAFARQLRQLPHMPAVVFVTAHAEHAVQAFELEAVDYLTKPVRLERLQQALDKVARWQRLTTADASAQTSGFLLIQDRGRTERVPLSDIVYLKAELKYVTVRTPSKSHIYDGSLNELEQAHPDRWLRIHRNALVARHRLRSLEHVHDKPSATEGAEEGDSWLLHLDGVDEPLAVSRRQLAAVREALAAC